MNFIIGASGFAKEVDWLLNEIDADYIVHYLVAKENTGQKINGAEIIGEEDFIRVSQKEENNNIFISISSPAIKEKVYEKLRKQTKSYFPTIMHPSVLYDRREAKVILGEGNIVCAGSILETNIKTGKFVHFNMGCTIGHDTLIGDYSTISPGAHISGDVTIGNKVFIGAGAVLLEKISICDGAVIGAGAVVTKSITQAGTYVGVPAKKIK